jgi:hypothetical protein
MKNVCFSKQDVQRAVGSEIDLIKVFDEHNTSTVASIYCINKRKFNQLKELHPQFKLLKPN